MDIIGSGTCSVGVPCDKTAELGPIGFRSIPGELRIGAFGCALEVTLRPAILELKAGIFEVVDPARRNIGDDNECAAFKDRAGHEAKPSGS
jgi:hypothetical protein